jgi:DNA replication protein DnaC
MSSDGSDDLTERLRRLGLRVRRDALAAFLAHVHKSRVGPTETLEQLADLEERARVAVNLARRTRFACLGSFKTLDRFDWAHPEQIDRALIERLVELEFVDRGENVLLKGGSGLARL